MANVVYVGNYPNTLTNDEILDIFQDFEDIVLLRSIRREKKCYSFILCRDQDQVVDVVFSLHDIDVGGRNLIVRASDDELQEMIEKINYEDEYDEEEYSNGYQSDGISQNCNSYSLECSGGPSKTGSTTFRQPQRPGRIASSSLASSATKTASSSTVKDNLLTNRQANPRYLFKSKGDSNNDSDKLFHKHGDKSPGKTKFDDSETASCASYCASVRSGSTSPCSVASSSRRGEKFSFVSVFNFPNGTTTEELQNLLVDFRPFKIIVRNPTAEGDRPTEAVVCFLKSRLATDAIMTLDNTIYKKRVLLVTECDDTSYISDLRNFPHK